MTVFTPRRLYTLFRGSIPIAVADFSYIPRTASWVKRGEAASILINPRRPEAWAKGICVLPMCSKYRCALSIIPIALTQNNPNGGLGNLIQHATKKLNWFHCNYSVRSFLDAFSPLRDMDIFACRKQYAWGAVDQAAFRLFVRELRVRFAARLSLYKCCSARFLLPEICMTARPSTRDEQQSH